MSRYVSLPLALGVFLFAVPASAQQGYVSGAYVGKNRPHGYIGVDGLGFATLGTVTSANAGYLDSGGGVGLFVGGRVSPVVSLEGTWDTTWHGQNYPGVGGGSAVNGFYLMSFGGAIRLNIPTEGMLEPYLRLGAGYSFVGARWAPAYNYSSVFAHGLDVVGGIGLELYAGPYFSLGGQVNSRGYWFNNPNVPAFSGLDDAQQYVSVLGFALSGTFHL